jgi:hypothetical protein
VRLRLAAELADREPGRPLGGVLEHETVVQVDEELRPLAGQAPSGDALPPE